MWQDLGLSNGGQLPFVAEQLRYAPPTLTSPTTVDITQAMIDAADGNLTLTYPATQDYIFTLPTAADLVGGVNIRGTRHSWMIGGTMRGGNAASSPMRAILRRIGNAGVAYHEGILFDCDFQYGLDAVDFGANGPYPSRGSMVIQNCRKINMYSTVVGFHADGFQYYGDTTNVYFDRVSYQTGYQGWFPDNQARATGVYATNIDISCTDDYESNGYPLYPKNSGASPYDRQPVFVMENIYTQERRVVPDYYLLIDDIYSLPAGICDATYSAAQEFSTAYLTYSLRDTVVSVNGTVPGSEIGTCRARLINDATGSQKKLFVYKIRMNTGHDLREVRSITRLASVPYATFNGTGARTAFTLPLTSLSTSTAVVKVGGVTLTPTTQVTIVGTEMTCASAPAIGTGNVTVEQANNFTANTVLTGGICTLINDHAPLDPALYRDVYSYLPKSDGSEALFDTIRVGNDITFVFYNVHCTNVKFGTPPRGPYCPDGWAGYGYADRIDAALPGGRYRTDATVPGAPTGLTATASTAGVDLLWIGPADNGGAILSDYTVQFKLTSEPTVWTTYDRAASLLVEMTVDGLTLASYDFRVACVNSEGTGAWSSTATATNTVPPIDITGATKASDFLTSVVAEYDFADIACYDGLSKIIHSRTTTGADGSAAADNDIFLGSNSVSGTVDDPVGVGTPGTIGFYFTCAADYFKFLGTLTTYWKSLHKTTGAQDHSIFIVMEAAEMTSVDANGVIFATNNATSSAGERIIQTWQGTGDDAVGQLGLQQRGDSGGTVVYSGTGIPSGRFFLLGITHAPNTTQFYIDSVTPISVAHTYSGSSGDSASWGLAAEGDGGVRLKITSKWKYVMAANAVLGKAQTTALRNFLQATGVL